MAITKETMELVNSVMLDQMTIEEKLNKCMELTVEFWNTFLTINSHPMDNQETCRDINDIQNRMYSIAHRHDIKLKNQR